MTKVVGDVAVIVGADVSAFERGMRRATHDTEKFQRTLSGMAARAARTGTLIAASGVAIGAGIVASARGAAQSAVEIQNLSNIAGIGVEEFQKYAAAAETVGFSQEKLSDVLKDVNDKVGDFLANGAGPLKDFFENIAPAVGVTAEEFARLSGPEALQLYVSSLEKAGLSQAQMTFYMEALANDATALLPLLRDNGRELGRLGDQAEQAGRIIDQDLIRNGVELDRKFTELSRTIETTAKRALLEYSDEIAALAGWVADVGLPALIDFGQGFIEFVDDLQPALDALGQFIGLAQAAAGVDVGPVAVPSAEDQARMDQEDADFNATDRDNSSNTGQFYVDEEGGVQSYGEDTPAIPGITAPSAPILISPPSSDDKTRTSRRSGGGGGLSREDFEAFQEQFMSDAEELEAWRLEQLDKLREFREAKLATEEEFNDAEQRIQAEHAEALDELDERSRNARLAAAQGFFGEMAGLMRSGNEKMFKVGKAAALAEAVVSGHAAAVAAWEKGMKTGGPPVAAAFAAASIARTASMISSIQSASPSGGGGGLAAGAGATAAAPQPLQVMVSGPSPDTFVRWGDVPAMFDVIQDEAGDRGMQVVFT